MKRVCAWCNAPLDPSGGREEAQAPITHGICPTCAEFMMGHTRRPLAEFVESLHGPVIVVDNDGVVQQANGRALDLLRKDLGAVQGKRGGDVIECENSRSAGGCGSTEYCQTGCVIRRSVTHTATTGEALQNQTARQMVFSPTGVEEARFLVATEKLGSLVMVRIEEVHGADPSS